METLVFDGLIFIFDKDRVSGLPLCCAYIQKATNSNYDVDFVLLAHSSVDLPPLLSSNRLYVKENFDFKCDVSDIRHFLSTPRHSMMRRILFIDSITFLIERIGFETAIALLSSLLTEGKFVAVVGIINDKAVPPTIRRCSAIASAVLFLDEFPIHGERSQLICRTMKRKKNLSISEKLESYAVQSDFTIKTYAVKKSDFQRTSDPWSDYLAEPFERLSFDVGFRLKKSEQSAKSNVLLPYTIAQNERGLVNMNLSAGKRVRAGGQIVYTPDVDDDLDDSDPDDDLMI